MDIFLRQQWKDPRLRSKEHAVNRTLTFNKKEVLDKIWKPDLYFHNVKSASFHEVTVPNILIRISPDGIILYSMRFVSYIYIRGSDFPSLKNQPFELKLS